MVETVSIYDQWGTDKDVEQEGIVLDYSEGNWLRCRRAGGANKPYQKAIERFSRKYRKQIELGVLTEDKANVELVRIYVDTIIIDGEFVDRDKKKIKLLGNKKDTARLLRDLPDLFANVREATGSMELFRIFDREEEAKN